MAGSAIWLDSTWQQLSGKRDRMSGRDSPIRNSASVRVVTLAPSCASVSRSSSDTTREELAKFDVHRPERPAGREALRK